MVVRRIREHVTQHNWFAVAIDLIIVVVGVFLGQQVSNWNVERLEEKQAGDYRVRLIDELDFNARQFALQRAYYLRAKDYGLQALASLNGSRPLSDRDFVVAAYQLTQVDLTHAKSGVYDEIATHGLIDRLGDAETQQLGSDFYLTVEVTQRIIDNIFPYRTMLREVMPYDLQIAIRRECGDRSIFHDGRLVGSRLVVPCPLAIDTARAARAATAIRRIPDVERQMTRYIASLDEKLDNLQLVEDQARAFQARLIRNPKGA